MDIALRDSIYLQREQLARVLRGPLARLAECCRPAWGNAEALDAILAESIRGIPHCSFVYCLEIGGVQICSSIGRDGIVPDHRGRDRSQLPYMKEPVPPWGFLLSDAYICADGHRPSLTALQAVHRNGESLGYLAANFDLRNLPATKALYEEPGHWRQVKGDPAIRGGVFQQCRVESPLDGNIEQALSILEELLTERGVFQSQIHFSSSQATIWTVEDPFRYRILDHEALSDPDVCLVYPPQPYPIEATIPPKDISPILQTLKALRMSDPTFYLRMASINIFNGMVSVTFSCDRSHYMPHDEFLAKNTSFWF
jgi:hypothetical protein